MMWFCFNIYNPDKTKKQIKQHKEVTVTRFLHKVYNIYKYQGVAFIRELLKSSAGVLRGFGKHLVT